MNRFITKNGIYLIAVLTANLIADLLINEIFDVLQKKSWENVGLRMLVIAIVFIPVMAIIEPIIKKVSQKYIQQSKRVGKSNMTGTIVGLLVAVAALYLGYAYVWYNMKLF